MSNVSVPRICVFYCVINVIWLLGDCSVQSAAVCLVCLTLYHSKQVLTMGWLCLSTVQRLAAGQMLVCLFGNNPRVQRNQAVHFLSQILVYLPLLRLFLLFAILCPILSVWYIVVYQFRIFLSSEQSHLCQDFLMLRETLDTKHIISHYPYLSVPYP